ncbi:MAG TPA: HlyD family efflux transporter periplasmic adaptor subunit [Acidobacteriota bacterium]|nr:HlyD family efflux transporter periplasmic adaptor subunit [Acidobacteriota bacterium]
MGILSVTLYRRKGPFITFVLVAGIVTALIILRQYPSAGKTAIPSAKLMTTQAGENSAFEVRRGRVQKVLLFDGELRAVRSHAIFASTSEEAKITYLPPEGSIVKPGDRLVELDSGTLLEKIKDAEEKIVAADNEIIKTQSTQESTLREMEVELSRLWLAYEQARVKADVPPDLVARREYQENQLAKEKAKTEYDNQLTKIAQKKKEQAAEIQVKVIEKQKLEVQLNKIKSNLDGMNIKAPSEGMVIYTDHWNERRKLQIGDVVWGGFPIVQLPDLRQMEVVAQVNEVDGPKISIGQRAKIVLDSFPKIEIEGSVREISQTAIKASWMAKAKIFVIVFSLDNTVIEIMKPGMSAQVSVPLAESDPGLLVPRSAVKFEGESAVVSRIEGEKGRRAVAVTILSSDPYHYTVADNGALKRGDRILSRWY